MIKRLLPLFLLLLAGCTTVVQESGLPENTLFFDEFVVGQTGDWLTEGDDAAVTAVINERMLININEPQTMQFVTLNEPIFNNFTLDVDTMIVTGSPESSCGVLIRMNSPNEFYRFSIRGDGLYMLERHDPDGWTRFMNDWESTTAIQQGVGQNNHIKVIAEGSSMTFYVNDIQVARINDSRYPQGSIALDAGTFGQTNLQVMFDNVLVTGAETAVVEIIEE
jgi:hypothetical protein